MKKPILIALLSFFYFTLHAQIAFEPGYFIDNNGERTDCFIKNSDRNNNPTKFEYRLLSNGATEVATIDSVKEFSIINTIHKYQRYNVKVARSSDDLKNLSTEKTIALEDAVLFLRVLVEGKASLFSYYDGSGFETFYFSMNGASVEPLLYSRYLTGENQIAENNGYKQQLLINLICPSFSPAYFSGMRYKRNVMVNTFIKYNECVQSEYVSLTAKKAKGFYRLAIKAGINAAKLEVNQMQSFIAPSSGGATPRTITYTTELDQKISPIVGVEIEYVFPSNKNKWSLFVEPTFHHYVNEYKAAIHRHLPSSIDPAIFGGERIPLTVNYSHIALPFGLKHNFFVNDNAQIFVGGAIAYNFLLNPSKAFEVEKINFYPDFDQKAVVMVPSFNLGLGYTYKNTFSIETKYHIGKTMLDNNHWKVRFNNSFLVALGYKFQR